MTTDDQPFTLADFAEAIAAGHDMRTPLLQRAADLELMLHLLVDPEDGPCVLDHNGYCQGHNLSRPCSIAQARRLLLGLPVPGITGAGTTEPADDYWQQEELQNHLIEARLAEETSDAA